MGNNVNEKNYGVFSDKYLRGEDVIRNLQTIYRLFIVQFIAGLRGVGYITFNFMRLSRRILTIPIIITTKEHFTMNYKGYGSSIFLDDNAILITPKNKFVAKALGMDSSKTARLIPILDLKGIHFKEATRLRNGEIGFHTVMGKNVFYYTWNQRLPIEDLISKLRTIGTNVVDRKFSKYQNDKAN
jgi:hypothetical protein